MLSLKCVVGTFGLASFALECIGPEFDQKGRQLTDKSHLENPVITANIFSRWVSPSLTVQLRSSELAFPNLVLWMDVAADGERGIAVYHRI